MIILKVAIPTRSKHTYSDVSPTFGHSRYFLIYETNDKSYSFLDCNVQESPGGAGIHSAQRIVDIHSDVVIANRCGENASKILKAENIMIYKATKDSAIENIKLLINGELLIMSDFRQSLHQ